MQGTVSGEAVSNAPATVAGSLVAIEARVAELEDKASHISDILVGPESCDEVPPPPLGGMIDATEALANRLTRVCARFSVIHDKLNGGAV